VSTAPDDEFLAAAQQALRGPAANALDELGWWELVDHVDDDADARSAVFAVFRAQGRELAGSPALGGLLAAPYLDGSSLAPGAVIAAVRRDSLRRGPVWLVVGDLGARRVLFDDPESGVFLAEPDALDVRPVEIPGHATVQEVTIDPSRHEVWPTAAPLDVLRARSLYLGRVALAAEILGTAEHAVDLAVQYAGDREQFGQPIGTFQAVRHLLAWARTDCVAVDAVVRAALDLLADPPERYGEVVKALAGRNGRRACQRSLQVLGGIGFTAEHPHHHHYSRVLALDSLLGTSAELTADLGGWLRTDAADPGFARRAMHPRLATDS
jgi:hypothetical protein